MRAGEMKYRLKLLKPIATTNNYGEEATTYQTERTVWAQRVKQSGSRSEEVGEHFPAHTAEFNIRDAHPVQENWRAQQLGGNLYTIVSIIPNRDKGYNTLLCDRVNE